MENVLHIASRIKHLPCNSTQLKERQSSSAAIERLSAFVSGLFISAPICHFKPYDRNNPRDKWRNNNETYRQSKQRVFTVCYVINCQFNVSAVVNDEKGKPCKSKDNVDGIYFRRPVGRFITSFSVYFKTTSTSSRSTGILYCWICVLSIQSTRLIWPRSDTIMVVAKSFNLFTTRWAV